MRLQPPQKMKFNTNKKLIMRRPFIIEKSQIALFPNDPKTYKPNNMKTTQQQ